MTNTEFPIQYENRQKEFSKDNLFQSSRIPLLLVNSYTPFPNEEIIVQITEPRYCIMIQQVLRRKSKEFCVIPYSTTFDEKLFIHSVGCKVEILNYNRLESGFYDVHIKGICTVEVKDKVLTDGYWWASIIEQNDIIPTSEEEIMYTTQNLKGIVNRFIELRNEYSLEWFV